MVQHMKSSPTARITILALLALVFVGCSDPQTSQECVDLAVDHFNRQKYSSSLRLCDKAIELEPSNYLGYHVRAIVVSELGNAQQAISDCNKAIELASDNDSKSGAYLLRSQVHELLGDRENVMKDRAEAERLRIKAKQEL